MCFPNRAAYQPRYDGEDRRTALTATKEQRREEDASRVKIMRAPGDAIVETEAGSDEPFPCRAAETLRHIWYHFFAVSSSC